MKKEDTKQYIYIVQASKETSWCKIGKTDNLERRLKQYNNMTGKSAENIYCCLFACEVDAMTQVENDIKKEYRKLRQEKKKEIYFFSPEMLKEYINFIKSHELFVKEISVKTEELKAKTITKFVKTPSLEARGLTKEQVITKAKKADNDEFYTRYEDIEKEVLMYDKEIWKNKTVFCNCDDAVDETNGKTNEKKTSAFALFFINNFKNLELKKLICTHYGGGIDLFNQGAKGTVYLITYEKKKDGTIKIEKQSPKGYTGSFDDPLSLKILNEEADIVCTNPPFSRAIDYWKITIGSGKKFLFISNIVNVLNTAYIAYFKNNRVWAGYNRVDYYLNPKKQLTDAAGHWYTNLPIKNRPKYRQLKIVPLKDIPEKFKKYDDNGILLVDNNYIPSDYEKTFGVSSRQILNGLLEKGYRYMNDKQYIPYINGKATWSRALVQKITN
jgi:predicted GIY-YIG superfamily endonuclease